SDRRCDHVRDNARRDRGPEPRTSSSREASVAGDAVAVAVEVINVGADDPDRASDVGRAVAAAAGAVDVAGDGYAAAAVIWITRRLRLHLFLGADRDHLRDRLPGGLGSQQLSAGLHAVGQRHLVGEGLHPGNTLGSDLAGALGKRRVFDVLL